MKKLKYKNIKFNSKLLFFKLSEPPTESIENLSKFPDLSQLIIFFNKFPDEVVVLETNPSSYKNFINKITKQDSTKFEVNFEDLIDLIFTNKGQSLLSNLTDEAKDVLKNLDSIVWNDNKKTGILSAYSKDQFAIFSNSLNKQKNKHKKNNTCPKITEVESITPTEKGQQILDYLEFRENFNHFNYKNYSIGKLNKTIVNEANNDCIQTFLDKLKNIQQKAINKVLKKVSFDDAFYYLLKNPTAEIEINSTLFSENLNNIVKKLSKKSILKINLTDLLRIINEQPYIISIKLSKETIDLLISNKYIARHNPNSDVFQILNLKNDLPASKNNNLTEIKKLLI
jgi:hypothetical protein